MKNICGADLYDLFSGALGFILFIVIATFLSCSAPTKEDYAPFLEFQAEMVDSILVSSAFPKGEISFDENIKYIGSETFILYEVARCEIHLFVELDTLGGYERIFWIQYEGYLPSNLLSFPASLKPGGLKYDYSDEPHKENISGKEFYLRTGIFSIDFTEEELAGTNKPGDSDFTHVARLLYHNGININSDVLSIRMVHLNHDRNEELMIIYYESIKEEDQKIIRLEGKGKDSPNWDIVSKDLITRAKERFKLKFD